MKKDNYPISKVDANYMKKLKEAKRILAKLKGKPLLEPAVESIELAIELIDREINTVMWINAITEIGEDKE